MSIWLILVLAGIGWINVRRVLRVVGRVIIVIAMVALAFGPGGAGSLASLEVLVVGLLMLGAGIAWPWIPDRLAVALARVGYAVRSHGARGLDGLRVNIGRVWRTARSRRPDAVPARDEREQQAMLRSPAEWFDIQNPPRAPRPDYDLDAEPWEKAAPAASAREEMNRTLEEVRRHLNGIITHVFAHRFADEVYTGPGWIDRLSQRRQERLGWEGRLSIYAEGGPIANCRVLFSVIADDWPLIGAYFRRDPSSPARELLGILDRYDRDGPAADDPGIAMRAFHEILESIRPQALELIKADYLRDQRFEQEAAAA